MQGLRELVMERIVENWLAGEDELFSMLPKQPGMSFEQQNDYTWDVILPHGAKITVDKNECYNLSRVLMLLDNEGLLHCLDQQACQRYR